MATVDPTLDAVERVARSRVTKPPASGQAARAAINLPRFAALAVQLGLALLIFWEFNIEGPSFFRLAVCCVVGFVIHYFVPFEWKKATFIALSLIGGVVVLSVPEAQATAANLSFFAAISCVGFALTLGLFFYGCLRLPLPFWARLSPVVATAAILAYARRGGFLPEPYWIIIGAIFMFRMIVYIYDVRGTKRPESLRDFLSYFFLLPNFYFVLFPVIDYTTFKKGYYAEDIHTLAQRGIAWILRGTAHLCLYRLVYQRVLIAPDEVHSIGTLCQYIFPSFWLYVRVSGQFHIIVGMLHLFGYRLPETNHHYFLASSFTDFWRRINIYWKDFMVKVVYYPVFFRLRKKSETLGLVLATLAVFTVTTVLHGYQVFWLHGTFAITLADCLFWAILGVLVLITVLYEAKRGWGRSASAKSNIAAKALSTVTVYVTISVLWSLWSSQSVGEWWDVVTYWR